MLLVLLMLLLLLILFWCYFGADVVAVVGMFLFVNIAVVGGGAVVCC